jgi:aminoglycoside 3-N-acetyltransferase
MWTKSQLTDAFCAVGLGVGDLVLVHSALRELGAVDGGADTVIDALLETVGPNGTLSMPTHTWKVVNELQPVFHQVLTPSNVGALTNVFRQRPGVIRSLHPTHSVAAIGPRASLLCVGHTDETPCSPTSPYGRLRHWGGKILIIGANLSCSTFFHGCEYWAGMPWAVRKTPIQLYSITAEREVIVVPTRSIFVNSWDQYPQLSPHLVKIGALRLGSIGSCQLHLLDAEMAATWLIAKLHKDPSIILPARLPADFPNG